MPNIAYRKRARYKYTLAATYRIRTGLGEYGPIDTRYMYLAQDGMLTIKHGYAWDGPSGPTFDTKTFMRGSLVHDALYQLMREGRIPLDRRGEADELLREICEADGMNGIRAAYVFWAVDTFGKKSADPARHNRVAP